MRRGFGYIVDLVAKLGANAAELKSQHPEGIRLQPADLDSWFQHGGLQTTTAIVRRSHLARNRVVSTVVPLGMGRYVGRECGWSWGRRRCMRR